jgi:cyanate permease
LPNPLVKVSIHLSGWLLWKERNRRVHERAALQPVALVGAVMEDARLWSQAGFVLIATLLGFGFSLCFLVSVVFFFARASGRAFSVLTYSELLSS